jgi:hypothetical protein
MPIFRHKSSQNVLNPTPNESYHFKMDDNNDYATDAQIASLIDAVLDKSNDALAKLKKSNHLARAELEELLKQTRDMLLAAIQMAQEISEETRARDADTSRPGGRSPN